MPEQKETILRDECGCTDHDAPEPLQGAYACAARKRGLSLQTCITMKDACTCDCHKDWEDFTLNYDYEKDPYDVQLADGTIVKWCWPNAGKMCAMDGSGRTWDHTSGIKVRLSPDHPLDDHE